MVAPNLFLAALEPLLQGGQTQIYALLVLCGISLILVISAIIRLCRRKNGAAMERVLTVVLCVAAVIALAVTGLCGYSYYRTAQAEIPPETTESTTVPTTAATTVPTTAETTAPPETTEATTAPTEPEVVFAPHHTENSDPANWDITWEISVDGEIVESYTREEPITFGDPSEYYALEGVSTFRGNNYRNNPTYGYADIQEETISYLWSTYNGSLNDWAGCGWTGQPQIVKWDEETKAIMNLYDWAKETEDLVEVIYGTLDGYVYFFELETGRQTRDSVYIGMNMKGSGTVDPRGYPLLYVGSGTEMEQGMHIVSLITGEVIYVTNSYDSFATRGWTAYDSAPLIDAETDTLIWPGENGVLYTIKLNTQYDMAAATISIDPDSAVKIRYSTCRSGYSYWVGMENSCVAVEGYLFVADNGGMFFCIDLNTMELVWAQDIADDTNCTPVFEWGKDGNGYLYIAPSLHWTASGGWGEVSLYKLDAQTGEILWQVPYSCGTIEDLSGGVQSSPVLGREGTDMEGLVIFSISYTPTISQGILVALDTQTGEVVWELTMDSYSWSSPVGVYTEEGKGYVLMPTFYGYMQLIDGATGEILDETYLGSHVESSAVVYENNVIIGTRGCEIFGLELN